MNAKAIVRQEHIGGGWIAALLLTLMLLSVTDSIITANWADGLEIIAPAALCGLLLGMLFARVPLRGWIAHLLMLIAGAPVTVALVGTLLPDFLIWQEKAIIIWERLLLWSSSATFGGTSTDNLMFVLQVAYLTWVLGYMTAWYVFRRRQVWGAIIPSGAALLFNLFYALPQNGIYLTLFILCSLLLIVRLNLQSMERWWQETSIGYAGDISFDFLTYGITFSVILMILAWALPSTIAVSAWSGVFDPLQTPWQQVEDQFTRVFGALNAVARPAPSTFFGTTLTMGGPVNLGTKPIMDIQANQGRYWRATTYDKYTGIGWINTHNDTVNIAADDSRLLVSFQDYARIPITQTVQVFISDQNILYAQSQPLIFRVPTELRYGQPPLSDPSAPMLDIAVARSRRPLRQGDVYTVISAVSIADEESLRQTSASYSPWIASTYLQLNDTLPERVRQLAEQITDKYQNPYDKAAAIERYLRAKISYNDNVSEPPQGRDGVDYTLFERPEGYCNYYASAMVVLARAVGIPARIVSGYSMGESQNGVFHVVEANAHSWVEVYFPRYGWIEFEPTSSKPEIERPKKQQSPDDSENLDEAQASRNRRTNKDIEDLRDIGTAGSFIFASSAWRDPRVLALVALGGLALLLLSAVGGWMWIESRRTGALAPAARLYETLLQYALWLGIRGRQGDTPFERAQKIGEALPSVRNQVDQAAELYVRERFAARALDQGERESLASLWTQVRDVWWRQVFLHWAARLIAPLRRLWHRIRRAVERWGTL